MLRFYQAVQEIHMTVTLVLMEIRMIRETQEILMMLVVTMIRMSSMHAWFQIGQSPLIFDILKCNTQPI